MFGIYRGRQPPLEGVVECEGNAFHYYNSGFDTLAPSTPLRERALNHRINAC